MKLKNVIPYCALCLFTITSCNKNNINRIEDTRELSIEDRTINSLTGVDALNRLINPTDNQISKRQLGVFYHVWHGTHNTPCDDISSTYNITNLLENNPDELNNPSIHTKNFHYWGEPLYGYYNSADPWVITKHIEILTACGVDYLAYDLTNSVVYPKAINSIFEILEKFQKQGFKVPKVVFITRTGSGGVINQAYSSWYKEGKYKSLWYSLDNKKPLIVGIKGEVAKLDNGQELLDFFDIRDIVWPTDPRQDYEGFPWMDWNYPQNNYSGTMVVSLAQHPGMRMSDQEESNRGRGFDYSNFKNDSNKVNEGSNFESQFNTVINANIEASKNVDPDLEVNNVFVTGFNEWIAQKLIDGAGRVYFVDTYNEEYSRDIEMMKGGYGDNYVLQLARLNRVYKYEEAKHYEYDMHTINISDNDLTDWDKVKHIYKDFEDDAISRNYLSSDQRHYLTNDTNRNDISKTYVTHDKNNLYIRVDTVNNITSRNSDDKCFMNVFINTNKNKDTFMGFDYVINRTQNGDKCSIERLKNGFKTSNTKYQAKINISNNVMEISIPLKALNINKDEMNISIKVTDNVINQEDEMNYYINGDCAPIGRLGYSYGY